jgi:beta-glucanase (GH16 family)
MRNPACRAPSLAAVIAALATMACSQPPSDSGPDPWASPASGDGGAPPGWTLTWSDEFDGPHGAAVDPTKWARDVGGSGWGNEELEYYTDGTQNAQLGGGYLTITAEAIPNGQSLSCWYGPCRYTSARLNTLGKFSQAYGHFEARIRIPAGQGLWPAFWLLGDNVNQVGWPACGEVDVMENAGASPSVNHGSLHAPGNAVMTATFDSPTSLATDFHVYSIDWTPQAIWFSVDGMVYETQSAADYPSAGWPFDQPFFIILNVAVGGRFGGSPDSTTTFPQTMTVDYVRVYSQAQ